MGVSALFGGVPGGLRILLGKRPRTAPFALSMILILHPLDAFGWKFRMCWMESDSASPAQRDLLRIQRPTFSARRLASVADAPRFPDFHRIGMSRISPEYAFRISNSWPSSGDWRADVVEGPGRAEYWMHSWGRLARELGGTPEGGDSTIWARTPGALLAGLEEDKLQIFSGALFVPPDDIARQLVQPAAADTLLLEGLPDGVAAEDSHRLRISGPVRDFRPDALMLKIHAPEEGEWMSYADVWDPEWAATVNRAPRTVTRANLA